MSVELSTVLGGISILDDGVTKTVNDAISGKLNETGGDITGTLRHPAFPGVYSNTDLGLGVVDYNSVKHCLFQGTTTSPHTAESYHRPMAYYERHVAGRLTYRQSPDSNWLLAPTFMVQTFIEEGGSNANCSIHSKITSRTAAGSPPTATPTNGSYQLGIDLSVNALCAYIGTVELSAPNGQNNRTGWAANFEAKWTSGNKPGNLVGIEVDIINQPEDASGQLPGVFDNYTAYWAQTAGKLSTCGFLCTDAGIPGNGWQYGMVLRANFAQWALWIDNLRGTNNVGLSQGAYIHIQDTTGGANILLCEAGSTNAGRFQVTTGTDNPVAVMVNNQMRQITIKNVNGVAVFAPV